MKQIEIAVRLDENMQSAISRLENKEIKKITHKNKEIDKNGDVISEQKINLDCSDLEKAKDLNEK